MRKITLFIFLSVFFYSCSDSMNPFSKDDLMNDSQLIAAIENDASAINIDAEDLPVPSLRVVEEEYFDHIFVSASISPKYGYSVSMGDMTRDVGDIAKIYFARDGRILGADDSIRNGIGDDRHRHTRKCFRFGFPLSFHFGDEHFTANSKEEFMSILKQRYQSSGVKEKPTFSYPIQLEYKPETDGGDPVIVTINSDDELKNAYQACRGDEHDKKCFSIEFPVSFYMPDGTIITAENEEDLSEKMKTFYASFSGRKQRPQLIYPVTIIFEDGSVMTINNLLEMRKAWKENCGKNSN